MPKTKTFSKHPQVQPRKFDDESQSIIDNLPVGVFRISYDGFGEILLANTELLKIFRFDSSENIQAIKMRDLFLDRDEWEDLNNELHLKSQVTGLEVQLKEINGSSFWASINARLIGEQDSNAGEWVEGTVEDISSRKSGEERNVSQMQNVP
jgi:PAS domain S-box-containing protein